MISRDRCKRGRNRRGLIDGRENGSR